MIGTRWQNYDIYPRPPKFLTTNVCIFQILVVNLQKNIKIKRKDKMNDFLPQLKKLQPITVAKSGKTMTGKEIFVMIKTKENDTVIIPVNKNLKPVDADYHYYSGDTAQLLRSIDSIKEAFQISWDENETTDVSLSQNPHLLYQLIRCKNLIDEKGHSISVHPDTTVLQLVLKKYGRNIEPHFVIAAKDNSEAEEYDGAKKYETNKLYISLLSDSFVLSDNVIYPIAPIGDNYQQLSYFATRFTEDMLEEYLSVFFSFIENVQVAYEDYTVEFSDTAIVPTLLFPLRRSMPTRPCSFDSWNRTRACRSTLCSSST